jgi:hypothetical protein
VIFLDLTLITARLATLQSSGVVDQIGIAATRDAAIVRGSALADSIWVVPGPLSIDAAAEIHRLVRSVQQIEIVAIHRDLATAPDTGATAYAALRAIRQGVSGLLYPASGWAPSGYERIEYVGGETIDCTEQAIASADQYEVPGYC